jgi:hypothetical protein
MGRSRRIISGSHVLGQVQEPIRLAVFQVKEIYVNRMGYVIILIIQTVVEHCIEVLVQTGLGMILLAMPIFVFLVSEVPGSRNTEYLGRIF